MADQKRTWYQSDRGMPKNREPNFRRIGRSYQKYHHRNDDLWNQRRKEVLYDLNNLKIRSDEPVSRYKAISHDAKKKMKRAKCYICLTRGHMYWNCPNKHQRADLKRKKTRAIQNCENITVNQQPDARNQHDGSVIPSQAWPVDGSEEHGWKDIWYISDEYERHMTPNLCTFKNFRPGSTCSSNTSKKGLDIQGYGEVVVMTESKVFMIPGVYYVPNITLNILSLNQLMIQGFEVKIKNSKGILKRVFEEDCSHVIEEGSNKVTVENLDKMVKNEELHKIDLVKEKAIKAIMHYYDALYFNGLTIEEKLEGDPTVVVPTRNDYESLIGFLEMVNEQEIMDECKDLVKEHFEMLVKWFYKDYMQVEERSTPVIINGTKICLLDLYLIVKGMGGHTQVTVKNKWNCIARAMGFPIGHADEIMQCYATHLSLLAAYYDVAKHYSSDVVTEAEDGRSTTGILASELPKEDATVCCSGAEAMVIEHESGKVQTGKIEFDDGQKLIVTFEGSNSGELADDEDSGTITSSDQSFDHEDGSNMEE